MTQQGTLKINTEKLLPIIKKWLYSDKEIFLRELVSNACDALSKLKILKEKNETSFEDTELKIEITLDKKNKTLTITDTGIGMTAQEVETYIAQLAFSGAEDFLNKYQTETEKDQVIGHFGLGFYSAYMVANLVEIDTLSYLPKAEAAFWSCDGTATYTLKKGLRTTRGTCITLHIEEEEFLETSRIKEILDTYCAFLPYPIYLNEEHCNHKDPLWLKSSSDCTRQEYLEFYRQLHPLEPEPVFWVHLHVDYPFHLKGILYFPHVHSRFDFQKTPMKLFCNRVFVSDQCQDLLPEYLSIMRGAIDSPDIPLNVSRSYLQMDKTVKSLANHISKKVADRLAILYRTEKETFLSHWEDVATIMKLGILHDEKFYERVKDFLLWKNSKGNWMTLQEYLEKHPDKIFYTQDPESYYLHLYKEKNVEVLLANGPLDILLLNFLETKLAPIKFQRIDSGIDEKILDTTKEKTLLDANGKSEAATIADFIKTHLDIKDLAVEAKSLATEHLPALLVLDEEKRRMRDTLSLSHKDLPSHFAYKKTFVVNTNSPLIQALFKQTDKELTKEILQHLYQLSLLSQKELPSKDFSTFISQNIIILEKLLKEKK